MVIFYKWMVQFWIYLSKVSLYYLDLKGDRQSLCLWESLWLQGDPTSPSRSSVLDVHWKDWYRSWNFNPLATWCKELTHWKRLWCWERLMGGGEGDDRGWWTRVWLNPGNWWWTRRPGVLWFMGSQRVGHNWATELKNNILTLLNISSYFQI